MLIPCLQIALPCEMNVIYLFHHKIELFLNVGNTLGLSDLFWKMKKVIPLTEVCHGVRVTVIRVIWENR